MHHFLKKGGLPLLTSVPYDCYRYSSLPANPALGWLLGTWPVNSSLHWYKTFPKWRGWLTVPKMFSQRICLCWIPAFLLETGTLQHAKQRMPTWQASNKNYRLEVPSGFLGQKPYTNVLALSLLEEKCACDSLMEETEHKEASCGFFQTQPVYPSPPCLCNKSRLNAESPDSLCWVSWKFSTFYFLPITITWGKHFSY